MASDPRYYSLHRPRLPSLSDLPDSPSVYSHAYNSPPSIDPDDETASTIRSLSTEGVYDDADDDDAASHRISIQGPRIRFHSRAPWETDDPVTRPSESDTSLKSSTISSKLRGKAIRADGLIRTLARGSSAASRPSVDSARSQASTTSFEVTAGNYSNSRGALYDLARQSMSTSSLSSSTTSASVRHQSSVRTINFPRPPHYFAQTHSLSSDVPPMTFESPPTHSSSFDTSRISNDRSAKPSSVPSPQERPSHDEFVHPYANPDLVVYHAPFPETSLHSVLGDATGSDSNSIITDSTSIRSAPYSVISTETSTTSLTSRDVPHGNARINGKEISSPISFIYQNDMSYVDRDNKFLSLHPPPVGFEGPIRSNPRSPTVTLISLQEAQARERIRSTTVHTTVARPKLPFPDPDDIPEKAEDQTDEMGTQARTHVRSTSVGTRFKEEESAVPTSASVPPGRPLKHKKSGFMRLFSGRNSDGERDRSLPPPVPSFADACVEETWHTRGTGKTSKLVLARAPKQSFSPILHSSDASRSTLASTSSTSSSPDAKRHSPSSRRRQPPPLSIVTKSNPNLAEGKGSPTGSNSPPLLSLTVPLSAPPGSTDFPSLKLRPVSVSFSSHFADIVAGSTDEPQRDVHTPSSAASSSTALSPFTPASARRSDDASANAVEMSGEEHLTIEWLQDELASAKKAWQQQIWELREQIRDLTSELEGFRAADKQEYCEVCGRGELLRCHVSPTDEQQPTWKRSIVNRPRARTGDTARFASGN